MVKELPAKPDYPKSKGAWTKEGHDLRWDAYLRAFTENITLRQAEDREGFARDALVNFAIRFDLPYPAVMQTRTVEQRRHMSETHTLSHRWLKQALKQTRR